MYERGMRSINTPITDSTSAITEGDRAVWLLQLFTPLKTTAEYLPAFALC